MSLQQRVYMQDEQATRCIVTQTCTLSLRLEREQVCQLSSLPPRTRCRVVTSPCFHRVRARRARARSRDETASHSSASLLIVSIHPPLRRHCLSKYAGNFTILKPASASCGNGLMSTRWAFLQLLPSLPPRVRAGVEASKGKCPPHRPLAVGERPSLSCEVLRSQVNQPR